MTDDYRPHPAQQWPVECPVCSALVPQSDEAILRHANSHKQDNIGRQIVTELEKFFRSGGRWTR